MPLHTSLWSACGDCPSFTAGVMLPWVLNHCLRQQEAILDLANDEAVAACNDSAQHRVSEARRRATAVGNGLEKPKAMKRKTPE